MMITIIEGGLERCMRLYCGVGLEKRNRIGKSNGI